MVPYTFGATSTATGGGIDYTDTTAGSLVIPAGAMSASIWLTLVNESLFEGDEALMIDLGAATNATNAAVNQQHTLTISDDEATAGVALSIAANDAAATEPTGSGQFTITLGRANNTRSTITVNFVTGGSATEGTDYAALPTSVSFAVGTDSTTLDVIPLDDVDIELAETVIVTLTGVNNTAVAIAASPGDAATVTIDDNDLDTDGDGVSDTEEQALGLDLNNPDTDGDGISDFEDDFDRDGYPDVFELRQGMDFLAADVDADDDNDGVPNAVEALAGTDIDPATDRDNDGVPDARELAIGSDPDDPDSISPAGSSDADGDGITNAAEVFLADQGGATDTTPATDTDRDGTPDIIELQQGSDPFANEQPVLWIDAAQGASKVRDAGAGGGIVTATARIGNVQKPDLVYDWSQTDPRLLAVATGGLNAKTLTFDPATLAPGEYMLVATAQRIVNGAGSGISTVRYNIRIVAGTPVIDSDADGAVDAGDSIDGLSTRRSNQLQIRANENGNFLLGVEPGIRLQAGSTARAAGVNQSGVTKDHIAQFGDGVGGPAADVEDDFAHAGGLNDFEITNLPSVGATVQLVIPQLAAIPANAVYRKFVAATGWQYFVEDGMDSIASASGASGLCPPPGDTAWVPGLNKGDLCVRLTIRDAGPNDADGNLNGLIKDPGGTCVPAGSGDLRSGVDGIGGAAVSPWWFALLGVPVLFRRVYGPVVAFRVMRVFSIYRSPAK